MCLLKTPFLLVPPRPPNIDAFADGAPGEVLALRHQLQVLQRTRPRRLRLTRADRWLQPYSLGKPGALVASAHIGVVSAQRPSQVAVLNSRRLRRYVTVRSMPKRVLALGVVLVCANTTVISQTATKAAINMTPIDDGFDERAGAALVEKGVLLWPSPLAPSRRRGVAACGGSLAALRSHERPLNRMTVLGAAA